MSNEAESYIIPKVPNKALKVYNFYCAGRMSERSVEMIEKAELKMLYYFNLLSDEQKDDFLLSVQALLAVGHTEGRIDQVKGA